MTGVGKWTVICRDLGPIARDVWGETVAPWNRGKRKERGEGQHQGEASGLRAEGICFNQKVGLPAAGRRRARTETGAACKLMPHAPCPMGPWCAQQALPLPGLTTARYIPRGMYTYMARVPSSGRIGRGSRSGATAGELGRRGPTRQTTGGVGRGWRVAESHTPFNDKTLAAPLSVTFCYLTTSRDADWGARVGL